MNTGNYVDKIRKKKYDSFTADRCENDESTISN